MYNHTHPRVPAKLPVHSRAAAAQKLDERPVRNIRGVYYSVPHRNPNPRGWRTRRHLKRKNLRRSNQQVAAIERIGTQWSMLPLAFGSLIVIVVLATVLVAFSAVVMATQQHYQQQVTTLADILPKDNLKMYDKHGTMIYQMTDQGLQTTVPLKDISPNLIHAEIAMEDQYFWTNPGYDITGIANAAAFIYFGLQDKPSATAASQLDLAQAAMLAGIPSAPIGRDPFVDPYSAFVRVQEVLLQMRLQGYITAEQERAAIAEVQQPHFFHRGVLPGMLAPHFANYAVNELANLLHVKRVDLSRSGLIVSTTLDLPLQNQILKIAQRHIAEMAATHNMSNAAAVLIDFHNGAIRTLLGNIDPNNPHYGAFDVAADGYRQPGSSFKPFIYTTAFEQGISPGTPVFDTPLTIQMCCGLPPYSPPNYDQRFHGLISYRYALQNSFNVPAVKVLLKTGVD